MTKLLCPRWFHVVLAIYQVSAERKHVYAQYLIRRIPGSLSYLREVLYSFEKQGWIRLVPVRGENFKNIVLTDEGVQLAEVVAKARELMESYER